MTEQQIKFCLKDIGENEVVDLSNIAKIISSDYFIEPDVNNFRFIVDYKNKNISIFKVVAFSKIIEKNQDKLKVPKGIEGIDWDRKKILGPVASKNYIVSYAYETKRVRISFKEIFGIFLKGDAL